MKQNGKWKGITNTACVVGLAISTMSLNGTMLINGNYELSKSAYHIDYETTSNTTNIVNNIYVQKKPDFHKEAESLFGVMRDATKEEQESISNYINSIAVDTGVNFFDLC